MFVMIVSGSPTHSVEVQVTNNDCSDAGGVGPTLLVTGIDESLHLVRRIESRKRNFSLDL